MYPWGRKFYWKVEDSVGKEPYWSECWKAHLITGFWFLLHLSMYVMLVVCTWSVIVFTRCWRRSFADLWYLLLWVGFSKKDVRKWIEIYMRYSTGLQECPRLALAFSGVRFKVSWASGDSETSSPPELVASFLHARHAWATTSFFNCQLFTETASHHPFVLASLSKTMPCILVTTPQITNTMPLEN